MERRSRGIILVCAIIVSIASTALATQIVYQSPQQLGEHSALVVRGKVVSVESYWNADHSKIFTRTRVGVDETYKGADQPTVDIVQLGGVVDNVRVTVHGALQWVPGEEVLLFVERQDSGGYRVSGFSQGKFHIERDPKTGVAYVNAPSLDGVELVGASGADGIRRPTKSDKVTVDTFVDQALGRR
jgi:hypothetical protein